MEQISWMYLCPSAPVLCLALVRAPQIFVDRPGAGRLQTRRLRAVRHNGWSGHHRETRGESGFVTLFSTVFGIYLLRHQALLCWAHADYHPRR